MPLFDRYLIVDWSASAKPKRGKDSIWLGYAGHDGLIDMGLEANPSTRTQAMSIIKNICVSIDAKSKLFIGFDFGFGYPVGAAKKMTGKACWRCVWQFLSNKFYDTQEAASSRFQIANDINKDCFDGVSQFWRCTNSLKGKLDYLSFDKVGRGDLPIADRRHCENVIPRAKSNWELLNPGSVGSQTMLGLSALGKFTNEPTLKERISVWPFETDFTDKEFKQITLAEIYPSAFTLAYEDAPLDHAQVKTLAHGFAALDREDKFKTLLQKPDSLEGKALNEVLTEEGWIVGISNNSNILKNAIDGAV